MTKVEIALSFIATLYMLNSVLTWCMAYPARAVLDRKLIEYWERTTGWKRLGDVMNAGIKSRDNDVVALRGVIQELGESCELRITFNLHKVPMSRECAAVIIDLAADNDEFKSILETICKGGGGSHR